MKASIQILSRTGWAVTAAVAVTALTPLPAHTQTAEEFKKLQEMVEQMQKTIEGQNARIAELEKVKTPPPAEAVVPGVTATNSPPIQTMEKVVAREAVGHQSPVTHRSSLNDQQAPAQRPGNLTLDPEYRGFIPVPQTPALIKFNAKPRVDFTDDNRNSGNPDRFVTATIPVEGEPSYGGGNQFNVNARGSQLSVDVRAPEVPGDFRFYYQNDFFGSGSGMSYRLQQLYGQYYNVTAGFTYSVFEDPDVWPDTVDYEGPNAMIYGRQPTVRYLLPLNEHWQLNFGLQQPSSDVDNTDLPDVTSVNHAPDGGFNVRWEAAEVGHVQFATLLRDVGADSPTLGDQSVLGWGLNLSSSLDVFGRDSVQTVLTYGHGYFHYANDNFTYPGFNGGDAAYDSSGNLTALPYFGVMIGYTHHWSASFRSTVTSGYLDLGNAASQGPLAYHQTYYGSANLVYQIRQRLSVGLECLYGKKEVQSGDTGDVFRVQLGLVYSLFD